MTKLTHLVGVIADAMAHDQRLCDKEQAPTGDDYNAMFQVLLLAHGMMPQLLEAVGHLKKVCAARAHQDHEFDVDTWYAEVRRTLESLR